jgi:hypothetical protein
MDFSVTEQVNVLARPTEWLFIGNGTAVCRMGIMLSHVLLPREELLKDLLLTRKQLQI